jgi:hypothetical protein
MQNTTVINAALLFLSFFMQKRQRTNERRKIKQRNGESFAQGEGEGEGRQKQPWKITANRQTDRKGEKTGKGGMIVTFVFNQQDCS